MKRCVIKVGNENGYILLIVLLFMQIGVLLGIYSLESCVIEFRVSHRVLQKQRMNRDLEYVMRGEEEKIRTFVPSCLVPIMSTSEITDQPLSWWRSQSCTGNFHSIDYYYVLEPLGQDPCAHIKRTKDAMAGYYRLTMLGISQDSEIRVLLQSTIVRPDITAHQCNERIHLVSSGRQSLNEVMVD
jgi:Tfp pilus assembly protein PilX